VYAIAFHGDGSLVATGDLGGLGRVWDLRSGKSVFTMKNHTRQLLSLDWSPNGYHVASGSEDATCAIWELRQQRLLYVVPAHASLVSHVKYSPGSGEVLATASFDKTIKLWSSRNWEPLSTLKGHEARVTGLGLFPESLSGLPTQGFFCVSAAFDRTVKVWGH
jgi:U4/U6 small nuclear ribonucleoprotein PRP4